MTLIDDLKKMKSKGRQVVSVDYVLKRLESIERHDCEHRVRLTENDKSYLRRKTTVLRNVGD